MIAANCAMERPWTPPSGASANGGHAEPELVLYNSLVDRKVPFVPLGGPGSRQVTWYTCGPTVYDSAHMGHARNYVSFDIVRRVLEDYFGYSIKFIMNVTDVEDKIILRARRKYLLQNYAAAVADGAKVCCCLAALAAAAAPASPSRCAHQRLVTPCLPPLPRRRCLMT